MTCHSHFWSIDPTLALAHNVRLFFETLCLLSMQHLMDSMDSIDLLHKIAKTPNILGGGGGGGGGWMAAAAEVEPPRPPTASNGGHMLAVPPERPVAAGGRRPARPPPQRGPPAAARPTAYARGWGRPRRAMPLPPQARQAA